MSSGSEKLPKSERLCSDRRTDALFAAGRWGRVDSLRFCFSIATIGAETGIATVGAGSVKTAKTAGSAVSAVTGAIETEPYAVTSDGHAPAAGAEPAISVLFSVPKKSFKRAWKRNLIKRRMRESYRRRKHSLAEALATSGRRIDLALICSPDLKNSPNPKTSPALKTATTSKPAIPDFATIDNAITQILEQIENRIRK